MKSGRQKENYRLQVDNLMGFFTKIKQWLDGWMESIQADRQGMQKLWAVVIETK